MCRDVDGDSAADDYPPKEALNTRAFCHFDVGF